MNTPWPGPATAVSAPHAAEAHSPLRPLVHLMYALHTLSWFSLGLFSVVAMALNVAKRGSTRSDFYLGHLRWQARSFWFTLLWLALSLPLWLLFVFPGWAAWSLIGLWYLYRFVRGWWAFAEMRPMPVPRG